MTPQELLRAAKLNEAIRVLGSEVRENPTDIKRRTFLFELLCFAGEFDRAAKQLNVLAQGSADAENGALLHRSALVAERQRGLFFESGESASVEQVSASRSGTINGRSFTTLEDADPRIGPRLEFFVAGEYMQLPFEYINTIRMEAPRLLRDLLWATARITASPTAKSGELGEVLLPVLYPFSWKYPSDEVRLGRVTEWQNVNGKGELPAGQKLLVVDGEEIVPFLEIREITFNSSAVEQSASA
jgi:type VI secretion system protein ImpE